MPSFPDLPESEGFSFQAPHWSRQQKRLFVRPVMRIKCIGEVASAVLAVLVSVSSFAVQPNLSIAEDFSVDPQLRGWSIFGDTNLFLWNEQERNLVVRWDSTRTNSYYIVPLGMLLTRRDSFSVSLDLLVDHYAGGVTPGKNGAMQIAFGFQNQADARREDFFRGAVRSPNLVEFNFFPDTGFGPTISPAVLSTNSILNYSGPSDFTIAAIPTGVVMRVTLAYSATNETASITITTNGVLAVPVTSARLSTNFTAFSSPFTDFAIDTFSITSYSDAGQDPQYAGSLLAHGTVDNVEVTLDPGPIQGFDGSYNGDVWNSSILTRAGWTYTLEVSSDLRTWTELGDPIIGRGGFAKLIDSEPPPTRRFYRLKAERTN